MKENKKTILQRIWLGIKLGWKLPSLPVSVERFHNHPLTRTFRVLGGISILLVLSKSVLVKYIFYIVFPLAFLQFIYIIVINLIKFIFIIYLWKNNKFQVRNSPLDRIASFTITLYSCIKGTCVLGLSGGTALGIGLGIDELLSYYGRDPVFKDILGRGLDQTLNNLGYKNPNKDITEIRDDIDILKYRYKELKALNKDIDELDSIGKEEGIEDSELIKEVKKDLKKTIEAEKASILNSRSRILSQLSENNAFKKK
jgi:hypothetical protein